MLSQKGSVLLVIMNDYGTDGYGYCHHNYRTAFESQHYGYQKHEMPGLVPLQGIIVIVSVTTLALFRAISIMVSIIPNASITSRIGPSVITSSIASMIVDVILVFVIRIQNVPSYRKPPNKSENSEIKVCGNCASISQYEP